MPEGRWDQSCPAYPYIYSFAKIVETVAVPGIQSEFGAVKLLKPSLGDKLGQFLKRVILVMIARDIGVVWC